LLNGEVIAVDQDRLGVQGDRVFKDGDREVWSRPLAGGGRAVVLFNRGETPADITVTWEHLHYPANLSARVRDLWAHRDLPRARGSFTARNVAPHGVRMVRIEP
jgi:alpha-galactosidase